MMRIIRIEALVVVDAYNRELGYTLILIILILSRMFLFDAPSVCGDQVNRNR